MQVQIHKTVVADARESSPHNRKKRTIPHLFLPFQPQQEQGSAPVSVSMHHDDARVVDGPQGFLPAAVPQGGWQQRGGVTPGGGLAQGPTSSNAVGNNTTTTTTTTTSLGGVGTTTIYEESEEDDDPSSTTDPASRDSRLPTGSSSSRGVAAVARAAAPKDRQPQPQVVYSQSPLSSSSSSQQDPGDLGHSQSYVGSRRVGVLPRVVATSRVCTRRRRTNTRLWFRSTTEKPLFRPIRSASPDSVAIDPYEPSPASGKRAKRIQSTNVDELIGAFKDSVLEEESDEDEEFNAVVVGDGMNGDPYAPSPASGRRAKRIQSTNVDNVIGTFDQDGDHLNTGKTTTLEQFDAVDGDPYSQSPASAS